MKAVSTRKQLLCSRVQDWKPFGQLWGLRTLWVTPRSAGGTSQEQRGSRRTLSWRQHLAWGYSCPRESPGVSFTELLLPSSSAKAQQLCLARKIQQKSRENYSAHCDTPKSAALLTLQHKVEWRGSPDRYQPFCRVILGHPWPYKSPG